MAHKPHIIFSNQVTGYLFIDVVNAFVANGYSCELYTGQIDAGNTPLSGEVKVTMLIRYNRNIAYKRIVTWLLFSLQSFFRLLFAGRGAELFIVSNPPSSPFVGYILRRLRGIKYHLLIYDVYPDALVQLGKASKAGFLNRLWSRWNTKLFGQANTVYTLSNNMAALIGNYNSKVRVEVIPNWADTSAIKPINKTTNSFALQYRQAGKITVMYSGNMGATHAIEKIADLARAFKADSSFGFMLIGDGAKKQMLQELKGKHQLDNLDILPYQPMSVLPYSLACADIGIVTLSAGAEDLSVPSKTYNLLAAGVALLVIASPQSELAHLVSLYKCGISFQEHETEKMIAFLQQVKQDPHVLAVMKANAVAAATHYTPANTAFYVSAFNSNTHVS
jgi:glycosyltransferase involved in cell wall biosynthesis